MEKSTGFKPYADSASIKACAIRLMKQNGQTTTLEVKLDLRQIGYIAFQSDVSHWMARLSDELGWSYACNGQFRVYQLEPFEVVQPWVEELLDICPN